MRNIEDQSNIYVRLKRPKSLTQKMYTRITLQEIKELEKKVGKVSKTTEKLWYFVKLFLDRLVCFSSITSWSLMYVFLKEFAAVSA